MKRIVTEQDNLIIEKAREAMNNAYAPYSNFKVGAAILLKSGEIIIGANVENGSPRLTNCAEQNALGTAYSQGFRKDDIVKVAVIGNTPKAISPCGACRQTLSELVNKECDIILTNTNRDDIVLTNIHELLPYEFEL